METCEIEEGHSPLLIGTDIMADLGISIDYAEGKVYQYCTHGCPPGEKIPCECEIARAAGSGLIVLKITDLNMFERFSPKIGTSRCTTRFQHAHGDGGKQHTQQKRNLLKRRKNVLV